MTEPGYQGAPSPDPNAPQTPSGVPGQYVPPAGASTPPGAPIPPGAPYQPGAPIAPPPGYASADDKTWALIAHFGGAAGNLFCGVLGFVAPLVAYLSRANSPSSRQHAVNALNFQILISGVSLILVIIRNALDFGLTGFAISTLLWLVNVAVLIVGIVFGVIAGIRANEGQVYKYPFSLSLIK
jgi:uncharacterized Tic20 family protein